MYFDGAVTFDRQGPVTPCPETKAQAVGREWEFVGNLEIRKVRICVMAATIFQGQGRKKGDRVCAAVPDLGRDGVTSTGTGSGGGSLTGEVPRTRVRGFTRVNE